MSSGNHKSKKNSSQPVDGEFEVPLPPTLRPHCGIWAEAGRVEIMIRLDGLAGGYQHITVDVPAKDGSLPEVKGSGPETIPLLAKIPQAAKQCGFRPKTFYNWIESGKLTKEHGLRSFGREYRIDWRLFKACVDRGEFAPCS